MSLETPLSKRIKRHVTGRIRNYFAVTSTGLETVCLKELVSLPLSVKDAAVVPGGVEFKGRLQDCYLANFYLRSANRILLRIDTFKATNFRQLEKRVIDIPWELYLRKDHRPKFHVTTKDCRLLHKDAIAELLLISISNRQAKVEFTDGNKRFSSTDQEIFIRGVDDRFTVSINSSGINLYKRGLKKHIGRAPLRETFAAAALLLAGYNGSEPLVDPMCGSGTFSLEGALMAKRIPPGWFRDFAFMGWPAFRPRRWEYIKRQAQSDFVRPEIPLIFASDTDQKACQKLKNCILKNGLSDVVKVHIKDFFKLAAQDFTDQTGLIALNPAYGRRIGGRQESEKLFHLICNRLKREYKGWKLVLLAPNRKLASQVPFRKIAYPVSHGGLKIMVVVAKIT